MTTAASRDAAPDVFLAARDSFLKSLAPQEQCEFRKCATKDELLAEVEKFTLFKSKHRNTSRILSKVQRFSDNLEPYFGILQTFFSVHPEWTALGWGAILLVLKLASNFVVFFEKLGDTLETLARRLPQYHSILKIGNSSFSEAFRFSLEQLYVDLFDFFTSVARVFTQKSGKVRKTHVVIADLVWKPFSVRFGSFLDRLKVHQTALKEEHDLMNTKLVAKVQAAQDEEIKEAKLHREMMNEYHELIESINSKITAERLRSVRKSILDFLHPLAPDDVQEPWWHARNQRETGTASWIFNDPTFTEWDSGCDKVSRTNHSNILWIRGNPGVGKSVLAASVQEFLEPRIRDEPILGEPKRAICYFFFSYRIADTRRPLNAYREILSQIFHQLQDDPEIIDCFSFAQSRSTSPIAGTPDLLALLSLLARNIPKLVIVLDGVDECDDPEGFISNIFSSIYGTTSKIAIFSRPNLKALRTAKQLRVLDLTRDILDLDINAYLSRRLDDLLQDGRLLDTSGKGLDDMLAHVLESANGMFLWARLMMDYLESPAFDRPAKRMEALWNTTRHESIEDMYVRVLTYMSTRIRLERQLARRIILWLTFQVRPLDARELWEVIHCLKEASPAPSTSMEMTASPSQLESFDHTVVLVCAGLVERTRDSYRLVHQSVAEFFSDWPEELERNSPHYLQFLVRPLEAHHLLAQECISFVMFRVPTQPLSGNMKLRAEPEAIRHVLPFADYGPIFWMQHLSTAVSSQACANRDSRSATAVVVSALQTLSNFMGKKLVVNLWVEMHYTLCRREDVMSDLDCLARWCRHITVEAFHLDRQSVQHLEAVERFYADMLELNRDWGSTLEMNPYFIWNDVTAFQKGESLQRTSAVSVHSMVPTNAEDSALCKNPLASISRSDTKGGRVGVLSVYPPKTSEKFWTTEARRTANTNIPYRGWVAVFEEFALIAGGRNKVKQTRIPLEVSQIEEHIKRSLVCRRMPRQLEAAGQGRAKTRITAAQLVASETVEWSLPFPMAISSELDVLLILERAYHLPRSSAAVRSLALPPFTTPLDICTPRGSAGVDDFISVSYKYQIGDNNRCILRQDYTTIITMNIGDPVITSINMLAMDNASGEYKLRRKHGTVNQPVVIKSCSLHPVLPLVLCVQRTSPVCSEGLLLALDENLQVPSSVGDNREFLDTRVPGRYPIYPPTSGVEYMQFSSCGETVVAKSAGNAFPDVISLKENPLYRSLLEQENQISPEKEPARTSSEIMISSQEGYSLTLGGTNLAMARPVVTTSSTSLIQFSNRTARQDIEIIRTDEDTVASQHVLSLPDSWENVGRGTSVSLGQLDEQNLRVVVNEGNREWYGGQSALKRQLPVLVEKDVRALLPSRKREAAEMLLQCNDDADEGDSDGKYGFGSRKRRGLIEYGSTWGRFQRDLDSRDDNWDDEDLGD